MESVILSVLSWSIPCGVSQVTTPVTSMSTVGGSVAVHVSARSEPSWNADNVGGMVNVTVAIGTAEQKKHKQKRSAIHTLLVGGAE